jgi:stage III sporulation protein AF
MFMMEWLADWLKQIVLLVLIAAFLDLLLPNNALERYVKLVMGLLIILAILTPVFQLVQKNLDLSTIAFTPIKEAGGSKGMEPLGDIRREAEHLKETQNRQIREQAERALEGEVKQTLEQHFGVEVMDANVKMEGESGQDLRLAQVSVTIRPGKGDQGQENRPVEPVRPVTIGIPAQDPSGAGRDSAADRELARQAARFIASSWSVAEEKVQVKIDAAHDGWR